MVILLQMFLSFFAYVCVRFSISLMTVAEGGHGPRGPQLTVFGERFHFRQSPSPLQFPPFFLTTSSLARATAWIIHC